MDTYPHYPSGQRVRITAGPYRGQDGIVRIRYADPNDSGVLYEVRLAGGEVVVLPSDGLAPAEPVKPTAWRSISGV